VAAKWKVESRDLFGRDVVQNLHVCPIMSRRTPTLEEHLFGRDAVTQKYNRWLYDPSNVIGGLVRTRLGTKLIIDGLASYNQFKK
jgi:hypothetical protein